LEIDDEFVQNFHRQILQLVYRGGFDYLTAYNLPNKLRNFYFREIIELNKRESEEIAKSRQQD